MFEIGFKISEYDYYLYYYNARVGYEIYLLLYVDDMVLAMIIRLKNLLKFEFDMKDLENVKKILGMVIKRNRKENLLIFFTRIIPK